MHCGICESCHLKCYLLIANYTSQKTEQQRFFLFHYSDDIMGEMASQITSLAIVYSTVYSGGDQRKHQSSASLAFMLGIPQGPVNSPHKWPVTRKIFHLMTSSCQGDIRYGIGSIKFSHCCHIFVAVRPGWWYHYILLVSYTSRGSLVLFLYYCAVL